MVFTLQILSISYCLYSAWGLALIWITLSCCWGTAKPINSFLSYNGFLPLSRLTYCAYLIHPTVMMITSFQMEAPMHLQHVIVVSFNGVATNFYVIIIIFLLSFTVDIVLRKCCGVFSVCIYSLHDV